MSENNNKLTGMEVLALVILFMVGDSLVLPLGVEARQYAWVVILIATVASVPIILMYIYIMNRYPDKDLFAIFYAVFGNKIGSLITLLYIFFLINLWALIVRNQSNFIVTLTLYDTPLYIFIVLIMLLNLMAIRKGLKVVCNVSKLFLYITIFFIFFVAFASIPNMSYEVYNTLLIDPDIGLLAKGGFSLISFPFTEIIIIPLLISKKKCKSLGKAIMVGSVISGILLTIVVLAELLVLGTDMYASSFYPIHSITRKIKIGGVLSRGEIIGLTIVVLGNVIKSSVVLQAAVKGIVSVFKLNRGKEITTATALFEVAWASTITHSTMDIITMAFIYPYFELQFGFVIPLITFIVILIKKGINGDAQKDGVKP